MSAIFLLIGFSLIVALGFLSFFLWAVKSGQYEDVHTPSMRMLWDDRPAAEKNSPEAPSTPRT